MFHELRARWRALLNPLQRDDIGWPLDSADLERDVDEPEPCPAASVPLNATGPSPESVS